METAAFTPGYSLGHLRQLLELFDGLVLLAELPAAGRPDWTPVGYLMAGLTYRDPTVAWVLNMGVRPETRRRGVGAALLTGGLTLLWQAGARLVKLTVAPHNTAAVRLYRRAGFDSVALVADYYGPGADRQILQRRLDPPAAQVNGGGV